MAEARFLSLKGEVEALKRARTFAPSGRARTIAEPQCGGLIWLWEWQVSFCRVKPAPLARHLRNKLASQPSSGQRRQSWPLSRECGSSMCQKCIELDKRIGRLKRIAAQLLDPATVEAAAQLVAEMEAQKKALHPEQS